MIRIARAAARALRAVSSSSCGVRTHCAWYSTSPLPETMSLLRSLSNGDEVYLVGTAHISKKSAEEVRSVIRAVRPDTVFLELCDARAAAMRSKMMSADGFVHSTGDGLPEPLRELLASLGAPGDVGEKVLGAYIKAIYQMFRLSGMDPGLEFKVALEEADRIGARVVLGDRSQGHTIQRLRAAITMADVMKYVMSGGRNPSEWLERDLVHKLESIDWNNPESVVELIKTRRAVRALTSYVRREFPRVATAMVDERDEIMTKGLLNQCGGRTVAVVGMAHMDGIEARWWQAQGGDSAVSLISGS